MICNIYSPSQSTALSSVKKNSGIQQTTNNIVKTSSEGPRERSWGCWFRTSLVRQVGTSDWD